MNTKVDSRRLYVPTLAGVYERLAPYSYAFMRFSAGAILVPHGAQKLFYGTAAATAVGIANKGIPFPLATAYFIGFVEFAVALCLAIGLFTRLAAAIVWIEMAVIIAVFIGPNGYFWTSRGYEFALLWLLLCTAIFFRGGGRWSVDHYLGKEF